MLTNTALFLLLYLTAVFLPLGTRTDNHGEYATIRADVDYISTSVNDYSSDLSSVTSASQCSTKCVFNELCRVVTYDGDLKRCRLFSSDIPQGKIFAKANTKIIRMIGGNQTYAMTSGRCSIIRRGATAVSRRFHTVDRLTDHLVIVAGGWDSPESADSYDPIHGVSNSTIRLSVPRAEHTSAIIRQSGNISTKLLLVGGLDTTGKLATGDVFDCATGIFSLVDNSMTSARYYYTATTIDNGCVLLTGGVDNNSVMLDTLELYNSTSNSFVSLPVRMSTSRAHHSATYIPSIQSVLIVGGKSQTSILQTYDLFNVSTLTFTVSNGISLYPRAYHTATLLLDDRVLLVGGQNNMRLSSSELYNPTANTFITVSNMSTDRADHAATLLANTGQVIVWGGQNQNNEMLNSCELYQP